MWEGKVRNYSLHTAADLGARADSAADNPLAMLEEARTADGEWRYNRQWAPAGHRAARAAKRLWETVAAALALAILAVPMAFVALAIKLDSPGPVFFRQGRHGLAREPFSIWKFRTMRHEAEDPGAPYRQARRNDDRVTRVGRFLRRTSLDELPQLINVLKGEMSLVGPRPHPVKMDLLHEHRIGLYPLRWSVRPGITGWAQVNGLRGETKTEEKMCKRVEYDVWYIENWSLLLDFRIVLFTLVSLFRDPNAY